MLVPGIISDSLSPPSLPTYLPTYLLYGWSHLITFTIPAQISVSVLCPAFVPTGISSSERCRSITAVGSSSENDIVDESTSSIGHDSYLACQANLNKKYAEGLVQAVQSGKKSADDIADHVFEAMDRGDFYIIPHKKILGAVAERFTDIQNLREPTTVKP